MIGANISVEDATDILDAVRVHIEFPFQAHIASLQAELAQAREEIARLSQVSA
jgi:hypothetical protein